FRFDFFLARIDKAIGFEPRLPRIQIEIAATMCDQLYMRAPFNNLAMLEHENLISTSYGAQTMRNNEGCAARHQRGESFLNQRFAFGVQTGCCLIQNENSRIGQNRSCDCHSLALASGKFDATLADDGVQAFLHAESELVHSS